MHLRIALLLVIISAVDAHGQEAALPRDETPFARPRTLCLVSAATPRALLQQLAKTVKAAGFNVKTVDWTNGEFEAWRADGEDSDRVLIWLERDLSDSSAFKVFLIYGRFEDVWSREREVIRIRVGQDYEQSRIGQLKQAIVALSLQ